MPFRRAHPALAGGSKSGMIAPTNCFISQRGTCELQCLGEEGPGQRAAPWPSRRLPPRESEQFNLFGFQSTRARLIARFAVAEDAWTDCQILSALDLLEPAKRSWSSFVRERQQRQRMDRRAVPGTPPLDASAVLADWLGAYLQGDQADAWLVSGLGDCTVCEHGLIYHGRYACLVCTVRLPRRFASEEERAAAWGSRCRVQLPPA